MEKTGSLKAYHELNVEQTNQSVPRQQQLITGNGLTGPADAERIHAENLELLSKMSKEEILNEQKKLLDVLDPKIISFIRKRGAKVSDTKAVKQSIDVNMDSIEEKPIKPKVKFEDIDLKAAKKWSHMDKIEYEKLEWMSEIPARDINSQYSTARFDFNGNLLNQTENVSYKLGLHHHGNEPDLAGYSIDELVHLTRSSFDQQRTLAIQTLSNIIEKAQCGEYHLQLKDPLLSQLIDNGIIFILRFSLDSQIEAIINVSLNAFSNLLQPSNQEAYLDRLFNMHSGHLCSSLYPSINLSNDDLKQLNDLEYLKIDVVKGLFRMNFLERLMYLIDTYKLSSDKSYEFIFEIFYRMLRHSSESCYEIYEKYTYQEILRHFSLILIYAKTVENIHISHSNK